jgi:hypothetical protein
MTLLFLCVVFLQGVKGVVPPPDGGYPNFTTAVGTKALQHLTFGSGNTGLGWYSLFSATTANFNTGAGAGTLALNTGDENTATGTAALLLNSNGFQNTANGALALLNNDTGSDNTAIGFQSLLQNIAGNNNTAAGVNSLGSNTMGSGNTAVGNLTLGFNTEGNSNTAVGVGALFHNTTFSNNTAVGATTLFNNTGTGNTALGSQVLQSNTTGQNNTAIGFGSLPDNTTGTGNIAIGAGSGLNITTTNNNIYIGTGVAGSAGEAGTIRIGSPNLAEQCFIGGIIDATVNMSGVPVYVDFNGQLGTILSSRRFKKAIQPMDKTSEAILALKPVTFNYKSDATNTSQFGLVAEDVEKVNPDLVVRDKEGKPYTVRYEAVNAMLLNEFLKEHRAFLEEQCKVERLEKQVATLTAGLQKVSAQLAASNPSLANLK